MASLLGLCLFGETLTAFEIIPCLFYPYLLLISSLVFIFLIPEKK